MCVCVCGMYVWDTKSQELCNKAYVLRHKKRAIVTTYKAICALLNREMRCTHVLGSHTSGKVMRK